MTTPDKAPALLRQKQVSARTGMARSTIYLRMAEGTFPKPVHIGERSVGWLESDVEAWIQARVSASRSPMPPLRGVRR